MAKPTDKRAPANVYQLKVTLRNAKPPIWRRLLVRGDVRLDKLHGVLQTAMGWLDGHLHLFVVGARIYAGRADDLDPIGIDERTVRLDQVLRAVGDRMRYDYDFGDGWMHDVVLEKVSTAVPGERLPWVVTGKRRCPPEDCGGVYGYEQLLKTLGDPKRADPGELREHYGAFDPAEFDADGCNLALHWRALQPPEKRSKRGAGRRKPAVAKRGSSARGRGPSLLE